MITKNKEMEIFKDVENKKLRVVREFDAPVADVWKAWTESSLLDEWWAPKPWKAITKSMQFKEGGFWLYCMEGPDGERSWVRADYEKIIPGKSFTARDSFCDEHGNKTDTVPSMYWKNNFIPTGNGTRVEVEITFANEADMKTIIEMGLEEGFTAALVNLDELLAG